MARAGRTSHLRPERTRSALATTALSISSHTWSYRPAIPSGPSPEAVSSILGGRCGTLEAVHACLLINQSASPCVGYRRTSQSGVGNATYPLAFPKGGTSCQSVSDGRYMNRGQDEDGSGAPSQQRRWRLKADEKAVIGRVVPVAALVLGVISGVSPFVGSNTQSRFDSFILSCIVCAVGALTVLLGVVLWKRRHDRVKLPLAVTVLAPVALLITGAASWIVGSNISGTHRDEVAPNTNTSTTKVSAPPLSYSTPGAPGDSTPSTASAAPRGSIDYPPNLAVVPQTIAARGRVFDLPKGHQVILLLRYDDCFFPERTSVDGADSWRSTIDVGGDEAAGKDFLLSLGDIGPDGVSALDKYTADEKARGSAVGILQPTRVG